MAVVKMWEVATKMTIMNDSGNGDVMVLMMATVRVMTVQMVSAVAVERTETAAMAMTLSIIMIS